jgi:hypothetical protein
VDLAREFVGEDRVNHALPLHEAQAGERGRDDPDVEVRFPAGTRAGMARVARAVVLDLENVRGESRFQLVA